MSKLRRKQRENRLSESLALMVFRTLRIFFVLFLGLIPDTGAVGAAALASAPAHQTIRKYSLASRLAGAVSPVFFICESTHKALPQSSSFVDDAQNLFKTMNRAPAIFCQPLTC